MSENSQKDELHIWIIEPHEPLIFRDGRPFSLKPGVLAQSLPFPFPSTTTGGVRTQAGLNEHGVFVYTSDDQLEALKALKVRGPLLVQLLSEKDGKEQEELLRWFLPAPADALLLNPPDGAPEETKAVLKRLVPIKTKDMLTDLDSTRKARGVEQGLYLVGMQPAIAGKPFARPPAYWNWSAFREWLVTPEGKDITMLDSLGIMGPQQEQRVHVRMDGDSHTGKDGALFGTRGLEFVASGEEKRLSGAGTLALAVIVDKGAKPVPQDGFAPLGGERRIVNWWNCTSNQLSCPQEELLDKIVVNEKGSWSCRVILLTPAYFEKGFYPTKLQEELDGVKPTVKAIAIQRPQVVSGWDFTRGQSGTPKKTRRLAPAGTVLFMELKGEQEAIRDWVKQHWLECISDQEQDRKDGFGLVVIGTWDGEPQEMEVSE